jgi:hypothetical protein
MIGLAAFGVSIWGIICAARICLASASIVLDVLFGAAPSGIVSSVIMSALAGGFAAITIALLRSFRRKAGSSTTSFLSALFNKGLAGPTLDAAFWGRVLVSGAIGWLIGAMTGASGAINFPQFIGGSADAILSISMPLMVFVGGGFSGPGGTGFWSVLFLIFVLIVLGIVIGILSGFIIHLIVAAVAGGTKGATKEVLLRALEDGEETPKRHRIRNGVVRGALAGLVVAALEAIFTVWGILGLQRPPG